MAALKNEVKRVIKEELPKILLEDPLFRTQIIGILTEAFAARGDLNKIIGEIKALREDFNRETIKMWGEIKALREETVKLREDFARETAKLWDEVKALREETVKLREDFARETAKLWDEVKALREDFNIGMENFAHYLQALGARWGLYAEDAFREGVRALLEKYFGVRVEKWTYYDSEGYVFGRPSMVDIDLAIIDSKHILIEVKSSVSRGDVGTFIKTASLYKRVFNIEPELMIVSPFVDDRALKLAKEAGIKVYTSLDKFRKRRTKFP